MMDVNRLRRIGEFNALFGKAPENFQIDRLLNVHIEAEIRVSHKINDLKIQRRTAVFLEMNAVQTGVFHSTDNVANHLFDERQLFQRSGIHHAEAENNTALLHALVIADAALQKIVVGKDELFAAEAASDVTRRAVQLFGGYGYMNEYPIAQLYKDARVQRIYGGTNEIMKEVITRSMGLGGK